MKMLWGGNMEKQPAHKSYVFEQGYKDVASAFATTWKKTFDPIKNEVDRLSSKLSGGKYALKKVALIEFSFFICLVLFVANILWGGKILPSTAKIVVGVVLAIVAVILYKKAWDTVPYSKLVMLEFTFVCDFFVFGAITIFNIVLNTLISVVLACAFILAVPLVYIGFLLVWFADFVYRTVKRISSRCPYCQNKFALPVYKCPSCGNKHTKLIPSSYGIFKRKCLCGEKIPTTFFNGRQKLESFCPVCEFNVRDGGKHVDVCIPVVGGTNSGKTCYINMAISQLEQTSLKENDLVFEYAFNDLNDYKATIDEMRKYHRPPQKTQDMGLNYYQFYLTPSGEKIKRLISICDIAGEVYQDDKVLGEQIGYRYANAFIVVIDPLSVREYKNELEKRFNVTNFRASTISIDEILGRLVTTLENMYSISSKVLLKTDVAVVFTKCDIPGLNEIIGSKAVTECMRNNKVSENQATNMVCEKFLSKYGEDNFVNSVKSKFNSVQYFTCSSFGYNQNESQYVPDGVEAPILWIYKKIFG